MKLLNTKPLFLYSALLCFASTSFAQTQQAPLTSLSKTTIEKSSLFSKERWSAGYSNYMNGQTFAEPSGASINHYLSLKHKFQSGWAVSGVFRPDSNFGNGKESVTMGDHYAKIDYPTLFDDGNGFSVKGNFRYYAPTSEKSQKAKLNGIVAPYFQAAKKFGDFELTYILIPKVYLNTVSSSGQKLGSQEHWLAGAYKLSQVFSLDFAVFPGWTYVRDQGTVYNELPIYPGFTVNVADNFSVSSYVEIYSANPDPKTTSLGGTLNYTFL